MAKTKRIGKNPLDHIVSGGVLETGKKAKGKPGKQGKRGLRKKPKAPPTERQTYHLSLDLIKKIRGHAYWERMKVSDVVNAALGQFFKGKTVKDVPKR